MSLYTGIRTQPATTKWFCCWQVSYHAALACANSPYIRKDFLFSCMAANMKKPLPHKKSIMKRFPCRFETQNMSVGCSDGMIQAGTCCGCAKWLPMSAMEGATEVGFTP
eukprot:1733457-Amphidinium_carterae.1